jgi:hypothetical protein
MAEGDFHRVGGGSVENLRLKSREETLKPPGISVILAPSPAEAARQIREAFPEAQGLHEAAQIVGTTTADKIRSAGFDLLPCPSKKLPGYHRIIHPEGLAGFHDENLVRLSEAFTNSTEHDA